MPHHLWDGLREGSGPEGPLRVEGSLAFTVDGPRGSTGGLLVGDGAVLYVSADDPSAVWDAAVAGAPRAQGGLSAVADLLAESGLSVEVDGPAGHVATVGAGVDSVLGRVVAGSRRVRPGRPAALRPLVVAQVRQAVGGPRTVLLAAAAVLVLLGRRRGQRS